MSIFAGLPQCFKQPPVNELKHEGLLPVYNLPPYVLILVKNKWLNGWLFTEVFDLVTSDASEHDDADGWRIKGRNLKIRISVNSCRPWVVTERLDEIENCLYYTEAFSGTPQGDSRTALAQSSPLFMFNEKQNNDTLVPVPCTDWNNPLLHCYNTR